MSDDGERLSDKNMKKGVSQNNDFLVTERCSLIFL